MLRSARPVLDDGARRAAMLAVVAGHLVLCGCRANSSTYGGHDSGAPAASARSTSPFAGAAASTVSSFDDTAQGLRERPADDGGEGRCCFDESLDGHCHHAAAPLPLFPSGRVPRCDSPDWRTMSTALWDFLGRRANLYAALGQPGAGERLRQEEICFAESFDRCEVNLAEGDGDLLFHVPRNTEWTGARFHKSRDGRWSVLQMESGEIP
jgi:hypothetical protein